jgi:phospholipase B1
VPTYQLVSFLPFFISDKCIPGQYRPAQDQGNAAQSGAIVANLPGQVAYLERFIHSTPDIDNSRDWKLLHLLIGGNDICGVCTEEYEKYQMQPDTYETRIRDILNSVRDRFPRTIVNLVGLFDVNGISKMTKTDPWCAKIRNVVPRLKQECTCALLPEPLGTITRRKMKALNDEYNRRLLKIAEDYRNTNETEFAVVFENTMVGMSIENWPVEGVSNIDCFHPSAHSHGLFASELW